MDVHVKLGDSKSNGFRNIRGAVFVLNERTNEHDKAYPNGAKRFTPKNQRKKLSSLNEMLALA